MISLISFGLAVVAGVLAGIGHPIVAVVTGSLAAALFPRVVDADVE